MLLTISKLSDIYLGFDVHMTATYIKTLIFVTRQRWRFIPLIPLLDGVRKLRDTKSNS